MYEFEIFFKFDIHQNGINFIERFSQSNWYPDSLVTFVYPEVRHHERSTKLLWKVCLMSVSQKHSVETLGSQFLSVGGDLTPFLQEI